MRNCNESLEAGRPPPLTLNFPIFCRSGFWLCLVSRHHFFFFFNSLCGVLGAVFTDWTGPLRRCPALSWVSEPLEEVFQLDWGGGQKRKRNAGSPRHQSIAGSGCIAGPHSSQEQLHILSPLPPPQFTGAGSPARRGRASALHTAKVGWVPPLQKW